MIARIARWTSIRFVSERRGFDPLCGLQRAVALGYQYLQLNPAESAPCPPMPHSTTGQVATPSRLRNGIDTRMRHNLTRAASPASLVS